MKKLLKVLPIVVVLLLCMTSVFAAIDTTMPSGGSSITDVDNAVNSIWATTLLIVRVLAFAALIFAGVRYMFASADTKADIKKQTVVLVVGAAIVFAAEPIVKFVQSVAKNIFGS